MTDPVPNLGGITDAGRCAAILARCDELEWTAERATLVGKADYSELPAAVAAHIETWNPKKVLLIVDGIRGLIDLRFVRDGYGAPMLAILARILDADPSPE